MICQTPENQLATLPLVARSPEGSTIDTVEFALVNPDADDCPTDGVPVGSSSVPPVELSVTRLPDPTYRDFRSHRDQTEIDCVTEVLKSFYGDVKADVFSNFTSCRTRAWFAQHSSTGEVQVIANACHNRWCTFCAHAKARHISDRVSKWLKDRNHPRQMELTLRSLPVPLRDQMDELYRCWRALRLDPMFRKVFLAGVWFFQVTYNAETGLWHPHLHCLFVGKYALQAAISEQWSSLTGGSTYVFIQGVKSIEKSADYCSRYASRPMLLSQVPSDRRIELVEALYHRRTCGTWGRDGLRPDISQEKFDPTPWIRLCTWSDLRDKLSNSKFHQAIWRAWKTREPLPFPVRSPVDPNNQEQTEKNSTAPPGQICGIFAGDLRDFCGQFAGHLDAIRA